MDNFVDNFGAPDPATDIGQIEMRSVVDLKPLEKNPRQHGEDSIAAIMASIREFGFRNPILVDGNRIVAGNGRWDAAKRLGLREVPTLPIRGLTREQIRAYIMADNATAERSTWDTDVLRFELGELRGLDFDISTIGFSDDYLANLLADRTEGLTDPDDVPEVPKEPVSRTGDLWILGRHRLLCGDSTVATDVERVLVGVQPHLMVTDPPYGIGRDKGVGGFGGFGPPIARRKYADEWDSARPPKEYFDALLIVAKHTLVFGGNFFADYLPVGNHWVVWDKLNTMPTFGDCELIWTNIKRNSVKKYTVEYNGLIGKERDRFHPTQKPAKLIEALLLDYTKPSQSVCDPFNGSGTTIIAAEMTGRACHAIEIAPAYIDVAVKRWQDFTGQLALLDGHGRTFDQISDERSSADRTVAA